MMPTKYNVSPGWFVVESNAGGGWAEQRRFDAGLNFQKAVHFATSYRGTKGIPTRIRKLGLDDVAYSLP